MSNPFDDNDEKSALFLVLVNDEGQHSLWPKGNPVPDGWSNIFGPGSRKDCLDFVEKNWTDMRPKSLVEAMNGITVRQHDSALPVGTARPS